MITAIIVLCILSIKDELNGLIDLYSTLQGNLKVYAINYLSMSVLGSLEFYFDFWIMDKINKSFTDYLLIQLLVAVVGCVFGVFLVKNKGRIKKFIKRKKISKALKKHWETRRNDTTKPREDTYDGARQEGQDNNTERVSKDNETKII